MKKTNQAAVEAYSRVIQELNSKFTPHAGQIDIGRDIFITGKRRVFVQCGRRFGKSEFAIYAIIRWAATNPDQECYYIGPFKKQVKRIVWKRLKKMLPYNQVKTVSESELCVHFHNGSTIYLDGSNDSDQDRGLEAHFVVYEEYKDFDPDYHGDIMGPVIAGSNAIHLVIGTPPDHDNHFTVLAEEYKNSEQSKYGYHEKSIFENPHVDHESIKEEIKKLESRGEWDRVQREYHGKYVKGGAGSIFPMLDKKKHVMPFKDVYNEYIRRDAGKLEWYLFTDPGTTTVFGVLFVAVNPFTKQIFILDEIYEKNQMETSVGRIWPRMQAKAAQLNPGVDPKSFDWYRGYDEAAAWFANEVSMQFDAHFLPTNKKDTNKEDGLSLIKDLLNEGLFIMSDRCVNLFTEMENYIKDNDGKIPKKNDHLIDTARYILQAANYDIHQVREPKTQSVSRRGYSLEEDLDGHFGDDWSV